jgi:DNA-binding CsgD family transcriptional regulator
MGSTTTQTEAEVRVNVRDLLQQILHEVDKQAPSNLPESTQHSVIEPDQDEISSEEVVFEMVVDGFQYILKRCYLESMKPACRLSPREQEVVRLVSRGHSNKAIASILEISPWTVSTHLRRVFIKLDVSSRAEMVACALKQGLLADLH